MSGPEDLLKTLHKRKVGLEREWVWKWKDLKKVALQKRGWGRLAELGETYYEHLISDDNVNSTSTFTDIMPNCSIIWLSCARYQSNRWSTISISGSFSQARRSSGRILYRWVTARIPPLNTTSSPGTSGAQLWGESGTLLWGVLICFEALTSPNVVTCAHEFNIYKL